MNNSVFGTTMENVREQKDINLGTTDKRRNQLVSESNYHKTKCFSENLLAIEIKKIKVKMNNERDSNKTVSIFILKTIFFILQNMFRSLHTSSSVKQIKSTVNIQMVKGFLKCYSIFKDTFKNFYLTIFMTINTNIMNKTIETFHINY